MNRIDLWKPEEYSYPLAFGFMPNLRTYLHEDEEIRPAMIVAPGGGYAVVVSTEGEIVAKKFQSFGYNAFVLTYTTNPLTMEPLMDQPLRDISRAVRYVRAHAEELHIDPNRVVICGFSAAGHLCASLCVHYQDVAEDPLYPGISNRPDAAILSYPVITGGEKAHRGSFDCLIRRNPSPELLQYWSLETQVTPETTPCFLWQTATDELVPVENSYLFAEALKENSVPFAHHVFSEGHHGLSLADEDWAEGRHGEPYPMEQMQKTLEAVRSGKIEVPEEVRQMFSNDWSMDWNEEPHEEVRIWPELAKTWLNSILGKE